MRRFFQSAAVAALLFGIAPVAAQAQMMALPHGLYAGVDAGVIVPQSISVRGSETSGGTTATFNGDLNFQSGPAAGFILGWHITPFIALEGNFEYAGFDTHSLSGTVAVTGSGSASGSVSVQGHLDMYNGLMNAIWSPLGAANWHGIAPYIGVGAGFSHMSETVSGIGGTSFGGNVSQDDTDLAANGIVGFDVAVMPQLTLGARYRLLYVNTSSNDSGFSNGDFIGHVITANATWHF